MSNPRRHSLLTFHRDPRWPLVLFALALVIRAVSMAYTAQSPVFWAPTSDEFEHWSLATHLAQGDWLGLERGPYHRPQFFAYALALLIALFGPHFWITHIFIALCDAAAIVVWHAVARRAMGRGAAALAGLMLALYWPFVHFAGTGYMESFAMLLNAALMLGILEFARRMAWRSRRGADAKGSRSPWPPLIFAGVMAGLSLMTRPQILIILPVLAAWLAWIGWRSRAKNSPPALSRLIAAPALFLVLTGAILLPNIARHWFVFGLWAPLGTGSEFAFTMSNNADGMSWATTSPGVEFKAFQHLPFVEAGTPPEIAPTREFWARRNKAYLTGHFDHFLINYARKFLMTLNAYEVHCTQNFQLMRSLSPVLRWLPGFGVLAPFGIVGLAAVLLGFLRRSGATSGNRSQRSARLVLALWVVVYLAGVALYLAIARHRLPALPPLLLLGAWAMMRMAWLARRAPGRLTPWLAGLLIAVAITRLPVIPAEYPEHERWWTQVNVGVALMQLEAPADAESALREATQILPGKPEGWRQLSLALAAQGRHGEAAEAQFKVVELVEQLYPRHAALLAEQLELAARFAADAGDLVTTERAARRIIVLAPAAAEGHNLLAYALLRQDRAAEAIPVITRALEIDPDNQAARTNLILAVKYLHDIESEVELPESLRKLMSE